MERDAFDEELEAEIAKVLDPGMERQRQVAVRDLHTGAGVPVVARVALVTVGIGVVVLVALWLVVIALA
jgi:hypothetical protein